MRWLTWMATLAFLVLGGCGGADDDASGPGAAQATSGPSDTSQSDTAQGQPDTAQGQPAAGKGAKPAVIESMSPPTKTQAKAAPQASGTTAQAQPTLEPEPADEGPPQMPEVNLGQGPYAQSTLLKVGDTVPEITATDLNGEATAVATPPEQELLVLVFWDTNNALSTLQLRWLQRDLAQSDGVHVVAINRGEPAETVQAIVEKENLTFPVLSDPEGALFGKFATQTVPRTYLIGAGGKILWLEVTFQGRTTIETLERAIAAAQAQ